MVFLVLDYVEVLFKSFVGDLQYPNHDNCLLLPSYKFNIQLLSTILNMTE